MSFPGSRHSIWIRAAECQHEPYFWNAWRGYDNLCGLLACRPITGLIISTKLSAFYSDRTWHKTWGRRRPYFTVGAILASIALCLMPNSSLLWMAVGVLWMWTHLSTLAWSRSAHLLAICSTLTTYRWVCHAEFLYRAWSRCSLLALPWMFSNWFGITDNSTGITSAVKYSSFTSEHLCCSVYSGRFWQQKNIRHPRNRSKPWRSVKKEKLTTNRSTCKKFFDIGLILLLISVAFGSVNLFHFKLEKELFMY